MTLAGYGKFGYRRVSGWLNWRSVRVVLALVKIQRRIGVKGHVAEIGVQHGKLLILLGLACDESERALAIDLFEPTRWGHGDRAVLQRNWDRYVGSPLAVIARNSNLVTRGDVLRAIGGPVRLFSVDGAHDRDTALNDLRLAATTLTPGGIILLDDFFSGACCGVTEAAFSFFQEQDVIVPFAMDDAKLYLTHREFAAQYLNRLCSSRMNASFKRRRLNGHELVVVDFSPYVSVLCQRCGTDFQLRNRLSQSLRIFIRNHANLFPLKVRRRFPVIDETMSSPI